MCTHHVALPPVVLLAGNPAWDEMGGSDMGPSMMAPVMLVMIIVAVLGGMMMGERGRKRTERKPL